MKQEAQKLKNKIKKIKRKVMTNHKENVRILSFLACLLGFLIFTNQVQSSNLLTKISVGYDDNVSDRINDAIKSKFLQCYLTSDIDVLPAQKTLLSLKIQNGMKFLTAKEFANESILINNVNTNLSYNLLGLFVPAFSGEVKTRTSIHSKNDVVPSEESFLRGLLGLSIKTIISKDLSAKAFYNYKATNLENFDQFDRQTHELGIRTDVKLLPNSTVNLQYHRETTKFNKWSEEKSLRNDSSDILTIGLQTYQNFLLDVNLSYENSKSSIDKYSYKDYILSVMLAKAISQNTVFELYSFLRTNSNVLIIENATRIDIEDEEKSIVTAKISRDITDQFVLEAQYELKRNKLINKEDIYKKNVISVSASYKF
ncbi:MAG: hypothetical protein ACPL7B_02520 [Candidatus Poribacteria bacterium]